MGGHSISGANSLLAPEMEWPPSRTWETPTSHVITSVRVLAAPNQPKNQIVRQTTSQNSYLYVNKLTSITSLVSYLLK